MLGQNSGGVLNSPSQIGLGASSAAQGQGTSSRSTTITGEMTAKILSVLPNGNYLIEGSRYVEVNDEKQTIEVTGEIRSDDISKENTVSSQRIANAKIKFTGTWPRIRGGQTWYFNPFFKLVRALLRPGEKL